VPRAVLDRIVLVSALISPALEPPGDDPEDEYLIALARAAHADALVSGDPHLLRLREIIPAITARQFLEALGAP
jgi:predicted nucleic acid-binding protein